MKFNTKRKSIPNRIIAAIVIVASVFMIFNLLYYAYWGRRHSVLYDVKTVYVVPDEENHSLYHLEFDVNVKRWTFDKNVYRYTMFSDIVGMPDYGVYDDNTPYFQLDGSSADFQIQCTLDLRDSDFRENGNYKELLNSYIYDLRFGALDENGNRVDSAELYMEDNKDVEIIYR